MTLLFAAAEVLVVGRPGSSLMTGSYAAADVAGEESVIAGVLLLAGLAARGGAKSFLHSCLVENM